MPFNWKEFVKDAKREIAIAIGAALAILGTITDYLTGWLGMFQ